MTGQFNLQTWLTFIKFKTNMWEQTLVKSFRVFDPKEDGVVQVETLKSSITKFVDKEQCNEQLLNALIYEARDFIDQNGLIDYEALVKVMLEEPDPLELPPEVAAQMVNY